MGRFLTRSAAEKPWIRKAMLAIAAITFAVGIVLSLRTSPDLLSNVDLPVILVMAGVAIPATLSLTAVEFSLSARLLGQSVPFGRAMTVTIIGSAANLLPMPGAMLVRVTALKSGGAPLRSGLAATALLALLSLGLGFAYSGLWATIIGGSLIALAILGGGVIGTLACWLVGRQLFDHAPAIVGLMLTRIALIAVDAARTYLAFMAIGVEAGFGQASVLTISTVLAAVVAFVPAGLGLREGLAAFIAPFVGIQPAEAFLATSVSRIVGLTIVMALTILLMNRRKEAQTS